MRRIRFLISCAFLASALPWSQGHAQERLKISYSSIDAPNANWYIAEDKKLYQKYGLDTDLVFISSSTTNVAAVVAGSVKVGNISGGALANAAVGGADLVCVGSFINTLPYELVVNESIKSPQSLKGKSVGISRVGSSSDVAARVLLKALGLEPDKDVAILQLGNHPAQLAGLEAGRVQGAMLSMPTSLRAKKMGFPLLADLQMLGLEYQHTSIATSKVLIKSKPDLVRDFMRAYIEGIH